MNESRKVNGLTWSSGKNFFTLRGESMKIGTNQGILINKLLSLFKIESTGFTPFIQTCSNSNHARDISGHCYLKGLKANVVPIKKKSKRTSPNRH